MALSERNVNAQIPSRRPPKPSSTPVDRKDENTAPTSTARFLAPTKSSSAKTTPPPRTTPQSRSGRSTPNPLPQSTRLSRRPAQPTLTPPTSKWSGRAAGSSHSSGTARECSKSSPNLLTPPPAQPLVGVITRRPLDVAANPRPSQISSGSAPLLNCAVQDDKPLPSRPMVYLAKDPSPSKDSRSLIDASEKPLRLSVGGTQYEWPSLTPSPIATPTVESSPTTRLSTSTASMLAAASQLTRTVTHKPGSADLKRAEKTFSPNSTTHPATAHVLQPERQRGPRETLSCSNAVTTTTAAKAFPSPTFPPRTSSLRGSVSTGSLAEASAEDSIRPISSRAHSPSPASFSRPRPTSISHIGSMAAPNTAKTPTPSKAHKTASRIPLPDQKKPTLVDIRSRRSSGIPTPKYERGLSFGGRRIDSPDPLKVSDRGIKRRQLKRTNTGGSTSTSSTIPTRILTTSISPAINRNHHTSSPDSTTGSTEEDEEEVTTPSDKSLHFVKHGYKPRHTKRLSHGTAEMPTTEFYEQSEIVLSRPPPSNSPFTGPLQTIESQSTLPVGTGSVASEDSFEDTKPKVVTKQTEFSTYAQRLSSIQDAHRANARGSFAPRAPLMGDTTRDNLLELLHEAKQEDAAVMRECGAGSGLDNATKQEISYTLSILECTSGVPPQSIDMDQLSLVFTRLKSGLENAPKSAAFVEDANAAERYLATHDSTVPQYTTTHQQTDQAATATRYITEHNAHEEDAKTVRSKWSSSTISDHSPTSRRHTYIDVVGDRPPRLPPKDYAESSIGYPSSMPASKAHQVLGSDTRLAERRTSTPTSFASRLPGSVRAAHEKARNAAGSMSRTNLHLTGRDKPETMPSVSTKVYTLAEEPVRGRTANSVQRTRSRSKSRYVLDKLKNGIFSAGKREKRNSQPPPVPPIKDALHGHKRPVSSQQQTPELGTLPTAASLIKMPTMSPSTEPVHPALRSAPSNASATSTTRGDEEGRRSLQNLSATLLGRARNESDPAKKERLLSFAKLLNDSLISAREAQISAETAQSAARSAQLSYEMTMKGVAMLQRLASSMNRR